MKLRLQMQKEQMQIQREQIQLQRSGDAADTDAESGGDRQDKR